ncbi:DUF397 domain-containing protein [Streptomyces sp. NPDC048417]
MSGPSSSGRTVSDSKAPARAVLSFPAEAFAAFLRSLKTARLPQ